MAALLLLAAAALRHAAPPLGLSVTITGHVDDDAAGLASNVWSTVTQWSPSAFETAAPAQLKATYPFITHIELFTATGGCYVGFPGCTSTRDLLNDPAQGLAAGINVTSLLQPLRNIVSAGFTPHIVTGNVPIALSASPHLGGFGFNSAPPRNMSEYRDYIAGVVRGFVAEFGHAEVASWRWGVFTEYNNVDWLNASAQSYFDTFDYTVCGLEDALGGAANVDVGAHACVQCGGGSSWDPLLFLHHAAGGVSKCSGRKPHLNFTANSFYEHAPGEPGDLSAFPSQGLVVLETAKQLGLDTSRFGIDEGRLLWGPEGPSAGLTTRAVGTGYQASWDALFFKMLAYSGSPGAYYSRWGVNANGDLFAEPTSTVANVAANVAQLSHKLAGGRLVLTKSVNKSSAVGFTQRSNDGNVCSGCNASAYKSQYCQCGCHGCRKDACCCPGGQPHPCIPCVEPPQVSIIDASVTIHNESDTLRALVFHHHPSFLAAGVASAAVELVLCGVNASSPTEAAAAAWTGVAGAPTGTVTRAGVSHANFWPLWWEDQQVANLSHANGDYTTWSAYSDSPPLASSKARGVFAAGLKRYQAAAALVPTAIDVAMSGGCVRVQLELPVHEVALVEITLL